MFNYSNMRLNISLLYSLKIDKQDKIVYKTELVMPKLLNS